MIEINGQSGFAIDLTQGYVRGNLERLYCRKRTNWSPSQCHLRLFFDQRHTESYAMLSKSIQFTASRALGYQRLWPWFRLVLVCLLMVGAAPSVFAAKSYSDNGDGTVTDPTTGLTWMRCSMGQTWDGSKSTCTGTAGIYTFDQANALTGTVTFAGQSDWRVPNIRELQTIYAPDIGGDVFPYTELYYWSKSSYSPNSNGAWTVFLNQNHPDFNFASKLNFYSVRLVRGGFTTGLLDVARPTTDYVDNGDGTIIHSPTGLTWKKCVEGMNWSDGVCSGVTSSFSWRLASLLTGTSFAGNSDWRVPSREELLTLVDYTTSSPALNATLFPGTWGEFWSSSLYNNGGVVNFTDGAAGISHIDNSHFARLVRGGLISVIPSSLIFSEQDLGTSSNAQSVTITNNSTAAVAITSIVSTGDFSFVNNCVSSIEVGGSCGLSVSFVPTAVGSRIGAITVSSNASGGPQKIPVSGIAKASTITTLALQPGWNLIGNGQDKPFDVVTLLGDPANVTSVWKWDALATGWQFYTPLMDANALQTFTASKGYAVLSAINPGEGFWVNAVQALSPVLPSGTPIRVTAFQPGQTYALKTAWNLVSVGNTLTPSAFNAGLSATPPAVGVVAPNITSLWAWDNPQAKWYFYAPSLEGQGGTALFDYTASKGYLDFTTTGKTLGNSTGFWVNKP
ncbi:MAG: DUF1566 domain-containing protein [Rhodoferax sp.]|nr:DUF1566 domain-containing protein [Rhodoferax sp.]